MISIIDDDPSIRAATDGLVRSLGYRAATFASAEEHLQSGRIDETSCVIADVQMPGLSGVELQSLLIARGHANDLCHRISRRANSQANSGSGRDRLLEQAV